MRHHELSPARTAAALVLAAGLAIPAGLDAQRTERFTVSGAQVAVYNLAGQVRVEAGTGSEVVVEVTRGGGDAGDLRIERGERDGFRSLAVVYGDDRVVYPRMGRGTNTELTVRDDGSFGGGILGGRRVRLTGRGAGMQAWADLRVLVPAGRTVSIHQAVGEVEVANVRGDVRVRSSSAPIRAHGTRGPLNLDTGSGGIEVRDVDEPSPRANQAVVAVAASSLNRGECTALRSAVDGWRPGWDL
ncbi:MAG TPA: hypothetical protein VEW03_09710, partial [Longimicrobiaceae bacterium]|nr:hypothetical protein [Longimicrobiaceae bacterium]